jgi:hypothetical protein
MAAKCHKCAENYSEHVDLRPYSLAELIEAFKGKED